MQISLPLWFMVIFSCSALCTVIFLFLTLEKQKKAKKEIEKLEEVCAKKNRLLVKLAFQMAYEDIDNGFEEREWMHLNDLKDVSDSAFYVLYKTTRNIIRDRYVLAVDDGMEDKKYNNVIERVEFLKIYELKEVYGYIDDIFKRFLKITYEKGYYDAKRYGKTTVVH